MRKLIGAIFSILFAVAAIAAASIWVCEYLSKTGKSFCFVVGNKVPDLKKETNEANEEY